MSSFKLGNIACPPKGAMMIPIDKKMSGTDLGHKFVGIT